MFIIAFTQLHTERMSVSSFLNFFYCSLYVYYYHGPVTLLVVPMSVPSQFYFFSCLIITTQSHKNSACIITQLFHFWDNSHVYS
jgi:hypothetical protein